MRCQQCGAVVTGSTCVPCRSKVLSGEDRPEWSWPGQSPTNAQGRQPAKPMRTDLPWWVTLLASVPPAGVTALFYLKLSHGDVPAVVGAVIGAALANLIISWLVSRIFKARPRLTWTITYYVLSLAAAVNMISAAASHPAVTKTYKPDITWPQGWAPMPMTGNSGAKGVASVGGSTEAAVLVVNGRNVAIMVALTIPMKDEDSLENELKAMDKGQLREAERLGYAMTMSPPVETTWLGRRALQEDSQFGADKGAPRQRLFVTHGDERVFCGVSYKAMASEFDKYLPALDMVKDRFACP